MALGKKEENFKRYLEKHFGLVLPEDMAIFYSGGVRLAAKSTLASNIKGDKGYAACDAGFNPTNALIQNFGHLIKKNVVQIEENEGKQFAAGKDIKRDLGVKSKFIIVKYLWHVIGLGYYSKEQKKILNKIPEKRRREIINEIK